MVFFLIRETFKVVIFCFRENFSLKQNITPIKNIQTADILLYLAGTQAWREYLFPEGLSCANDTAFGILLSINSIPFQIYGNTSTHINLVFFTAKEIGLLGVFTLVVSSCINLLVA